MISRAVTYPRLSATAFRLGIFAVFAACLTAGCQTTQTAWRSNTLSEVSRIVDVTGVDTVTIKSGATVKLLGIRCVAPDPLAAPDAAETEHTAELALEAIDFLRERSRDAICTIEYEGHRRTADNDGCTVAYVYVEGNMLNRELLIRGYACADTDADYGLKDEFLALEKKARKKQLGLWSSVPTAEPPQPVAPPPVVAEPVVAEPVPAEDGPQIVPWGEAAKYVDQEITVEGTVVGAYRAERVCFINFHSDYERHFRAVIFDMDLPNFPPSPEAFYTGKNLRITGTVDMYRGRPQMVLESQDQVKVVE